MKSKVKLTWKKVKGADGYEIYRATSKKGKYQKIKTLKKGTIVSYTDGKAKKGKTYYYKVRAVKKCRKNIGERNCFKCSALWKIKRFIIIMIIWSVDKADSKKSVRIKTDPARIFLLIHDNRFPVRRSIV